MRCDVNTILERMRARVHHSSDSDLSDIERAAATSRLQGGAPVRIVDPSDSRGTLTIRDKSSLGVKYDEEKEPIDLVAPELLVGVSRVLGFGATKYAPRNWEKGMRWGRVFAATMRHLWKWWGGEAVDHETGYSHLWHAATNIMFLIAYEARGAGEDDRPMNKDKSIK